ncbi:MAG: hypothetical protein ACI9OJ_003106 [Myxococcota bacterium]
MKKHWQFVLGAGLVIYLLVVPFRFQLEANADTERDLFRTWGLLHGDWPAKTPRIDHSPIDLGPAWYIATALPLSLFDGDARWIHVTHVFWLMVGLTLAYGAVRSRAGPAAAVAFVVLFGTSNFISQVMVRVWHPAMFPAGALIWFGLVAFALDGRSAQIRAWSLTMAWLLMIPLLQLHLVAAPYGMALVFLTVRRLRDDRVRGGRLPLAISVIVPIGLAVLWGIKLSAISWSQAGALTSERMNRTGAVGAALVEIPQFFASAWASPMFRWLFVLVLGFAVFEAACALRGWRKDGRASLSAWILLQIAFGFPMVLYLARLAPQARYFSGIIPGIYVLAGLGIGRSLKNVPELKQWVITASVGIFVLAGGWGQWPTPDGHPPQTMGELTLHEQAVFAAAARDRGIDSRDLPTRAHGSVYGGLSALRWVSFSLDSSRTVSAKAPVADMFVGPLGFPEPAITTSREVIERPGTRPLVIATMEPRLDSMHTKIRVGAVPCPIRLPYRWGPLTATEYAEFDVPQSLDVERCRADRRAAMTIEARLTKSKPAPLHLVLGWFDVAAQYQKRAEVTVRDAAGNPIEVVHIDSEMLRNVAVFSFQPPTPGFSLTLSPLETIASIDIY